MQVDSNGRLTPLSKRRGSRCRHARRRAHRPATLNHSALLPSPPGPRVFSDCRTVATFMEAPTSTVDSASRSSQVHRGGPLTHARTCRATGGLARIGRDPGRVGAQRIVRHRPNRDAGPQSASPNRRSSSYRWPRSRARRPPARRRVFTAGRSSAPAHRLKITEVLRAGTREFDSGRLLVWDGCVARSVSCWSMIIRW